MKALLLDLALVILALIVLLPVVNDILQQMAEAIR